MQHPPAHRERWGSDASEESLRFADEKRCLQLSKYIYKKGYKKLKNPVLSGLEPGVKFGPKSREVGDDSNEFEPTIGLMRTRRGELPPYTPHSACKLESKKRACSEVVLRRRKRDWAGLCALATGRLLCGEPAPACACTIILRMSGMPSPAPIGFQVNLPSAAPRGRTLCWLSS